MISLKSNSNKNNGYRLAASNLQVHMWLKLSINRRNLMIDLKPVVFMIKFSTLSRNYSKETKEVHSDTYLIKRRRPHPILIEAMATRRSTPSHQRSWLYFQKRMNNRCCQEFNSKAIQFSNQETRGWEKKRMLWQRNINQIHSSGRSILQWHLF